MTTAAETRHLLIKMAQRRQRAGSGSSREFLLKRTTTMRFPDLTSILSPLPWAATGAAAARLYMPERMTNDLDILVKKGDAISVRRKLEDGGATYRGGLSIGGTSWLLRDGFPLDVIECEEEWVAVALQEAEHNRDANGMPVLPLAFQILMKFRASRVQDLADMTRMLGQATDEQLQSVRELFSVQMPKELDDLESLISLGRLELE